MLREQGLGFLVVDASMDDDILTLLPVDGRGNFVFVAELDSIDDSDDFILHGIVNTTVASIANGRRGLTKLRPATAG